MSTETPAPVAEPVATPAAPVVPDAAKADEPLGAPGLAALQSEREARKVAEKATADALAKIKTFEDAQKTEAEKQAEQLAEFQRENAELKSAKTRAEVAAAKGVPAALLSGGTQEELEASADALIAFRGEQKAAPSSSAIGRANSTSGTTTTADAFASFVEGQLN